MNTAPMAQPTIAATVTLPAEAPAPVTQPVAAAATADADAAAQAQAKLEEEKKQEAQRIQAQEEQRTKERNQVIEQIKTMLNSELAEVANFKTSCLTNFDNNTNRIVGVSLQARKALTQRNAEERRDALEELEKQQRVLARDQQTMQDLISNPNTDAKLFYNSVSTTIGKMRSNRQDMTARLKGLDSDIAKAPTKTPLFQIKLK
jgi:HD-GYP domain-containing protein (c-di-GMP phosphodiesterase class II)